jgi:hypothetical protein
VSINVKNLEDLEDKEIDEDIKIEKKKRGKKDIFVLNF